MGRASNSDVYYVEVDEVLYSRVPMPSPAIGFGTCLV